MWFEILVVLFLGKVWCGKQLTSYTRYTVAILAKMGGEEDVLTLEGLEGLPLACSSTT